MKAQWIKACGQCQETEIASIIWEQNISLQYYLAGYTDRYDSGMVCADIWNDMDCHRLLELRAFGREQEILFIRTCIGTNFKWRVTDDTGLRETDYIDTDQYIDGNTECDKDLPLQDGQNAVRVRAYIEYDDNGMAFVSDHRVCGFIKKEGGAKV